jgi:diacylglycerol kinase family enzyme
VWAIVSLICIALLVVLLVGLIVTDIGAVLVALVGLALGAWGGWWLITERMPRRAVGAVGLVAGVAAVVWALVLGVEEGRRAWWMPLLVVALVAGALASARAAVAATLREIDLDSVFPAFTPRRPVLICNPKSGGGKVERFDIVEKARAAGVEVVLLEPGMDLEQLARDAVARGADCLGMAGGDGSQALVASIAVEHGLPFVCISAGTRNHFALDLGLDRDDPSRGLAAFTDGVVRRIDIAWVGDRVFVNNVSLGVYAQIVEQDSYRDAKLATTAESLPELLGRTAEPFDLQFTDPDGREVDGAFVVLVSNNPYVLGPTLDVSQRRSLTTGQLGVFAVTARTGAEAAALVARSAIGRGAADPNLHQFTAPTFEVRSRSGRAGVGIDGEALVLDTPLRFTIKHGGLQVLVPRDNPGVTLTKHYRSFGVRGLWDIAMGRTPALSTGA